MEPLKKRSLLELRESRKELLNIKKEALSFSSIAEWWLPRWISTFKKVEGLGGSLILVNITMYLQGYNNEISFEVLNAIRLRIVGLLDRNMSGLDSQQIVKPVLDELILQVKETKLSTLLKEFNNSKVTSPNLAALGFRTIITLIIRERAKIIKLDSKLAIKDDLDFEPDIKLALADNIFSSEDAKLLKRYLTGGNKDIFDNVAHKPGEKALVDKDYLNDGVNLLNQLLPSIIK